MSTATAPAERADAPDAADPPGGRARAALRMLPFRALGALLLVGALDPARWPDHLCPQWFFGALAAVAGLWAGPPLVRRPVFESYRWRHRLARHRNTLLAAAGALAAALQNPPVWLMAVETLLLLGYLMLVDAASAAARTARAQAAQALCAAAASALVLLAALAPVTGGSWARLVAGAAALGALALVYAGLRLRRPASHGDGHTGAQPPGAPRH